MSYIGNVNVGGTTHLVGSTLYGTCTTAANTAAKVVTCANFDQLLTGVTIHVKFSNVNTASNPTLNVNSTGAKAIRRYGSTAPGQTAATSWQENSVVSFTYDGTYWFLNDWLNDNTTYSVATTSANGLMSSTDKTKLDGMKTVEVSTSEPTQSYVSVWVDTDEEGDRIIPEMMIHKSATLTSSSMPYTISDSRITSIMRVCNTVFGTPAYVKSDITWTTGDGYVTFTGTISGSTSINFDLIEAQT